MATALARGWAEPVWVSDPIAERAQALVDQFGGEVCATNSDVAIASDIVILCHKPAQLGQVADEIRSAGTPVVSILGSVELAAVRAAYGSTSAYRVLPNLPVEVRQGVLCWPVGNGDDSFATSLKDLFSRLGKVIELDESLIETAMALSSNAPAFVSLVVEAMVDAGVRNGLPPALAGSLAVQTLAGTATLLQERDGDTLAVRRQVTSPGGSTARGLAALERAGLRAAFDGAVEAVLRGAR